MENKKEITVQALVSVGKHLRKSIEANQAQGYISPMLFDEKQAFRTGLAEMMRQRQNDLRDRQTRREEYDEICRLIGATLIEFED